MSFLMALRWLALAGIVAFTAGFVHSCDKKKYDKLAAEYNQLKGGVAAVGRAQDVQTAKQTLADIKAKERADEEHARRAAVARSTIADLRLRLDAERGARGGFVPPAPSGSQCPQGLACFDRAELERALRDHRTAVRGLADESAAVERALNTAKAWAQR